MSLTSPASGVAYLAIAVSGAAYVELSYNQILQWTVTTLGLGFALSLLCSEFRSDYKMRQHLQGMDSVLVAYRRVSIFAMSLALTRDWNRSPNLRERYLQNARAQAECLGAWESLAPYIEGYSSEKDDDRAAEFETKIVHTLDLTSQEYGVLYRAINGLGLLVGSIVAKTVGDESVEEVTALTNFVVRTLKILVSRRPDIFPSRVMRRIESGLGDLATGPLALDSPRMYYWLLVMVYLQIFWSSHPSTRAIRTFLAFGPGPASPSFAQLVRPLFRRVAGTDDLMTIAMKLSDPAWLAGGESLMVFLSPPAPPSATI